ncbi:Protein of unknown function DUF58 [Bifidobacterium bohemicum]|nr:DUF58 domain-containing protein [Bifidobacterium bohemicum]SCC08549.1 Protein of unknown function DUF58 [Bifidobacterium bohemicum]
MREHRRRGAGRRRPSGDGRRPLEKLVNGKHGPKNRRTLVKAFHTAPERLTAYISPLGWAVGSLGIVCLAVFPVLGWHELLVCGTIALTMCLAGVIMTLGNTRFNASLKLSDERITVGDMVSVSVSIDNPSRTPTVSADGDLPMGEVHERFRITALTPGKSQQRNVEFRATARAVLPVGPLRICKGDPFGLIRHERSLSDAIKVYIHPRTVRLNTLDSGRFRDLEGGPSGQVVDDDLDFYGLREYRPGDDIRNIHWLSSAKTGTMMVRQYEATKRTDTSITLGVDPIDYRNENEFELAVSLAASIGAQCLLQDRPLKAQASTQECSPHTATEFLDWTSSIEPDLDENANLAITTLKNSPNASFYFFVIGSATNLARIRRVASALPKASVCIMLKASIGQESLIRQYDGFTMATVPTLDDLPLVMEALK